ncbi:hypothetical protein GCM10023238_04520 [Streptomyces heliomycini]
MRRAGRRHRGQQPGQLARRVEERLRAPVGDLPLGGGESGEGVFSFAGTAAGGEAGGEPARTTTAMGDGEDSAAAPNASACRTTSARSGRSRSASLGCAAATASYRAASSLLSGPHARVPGRQAEDGCHRRSPDSSDPAEQPATSRAAGATASRLLLRGPNGHAEAGERSRQTSSGLVRTQRRREGPGPVITVPVAPARGAQRHPP